ncbi:hypothetical protein SERLADRAFT_443774 [Serpula lacrymans var. lacrymans S7.9]|uniref:Uncharacterized protein n=1 Tax=Serpula lacrymans var. lacrymans (strain S7.9) TaxID=578457 RepID=F8PDI0_SERL9|nr:uncharacterized protein SERLADRAFT_443774 [Serpula lacrymans var. lacrymans S7.9]EGO18801.1 hypothetical protein SERLADRAFT_443774 [Serpula lacrymans var. lacrymans S7.9]
MSASVMQTMSLLTMKNAQAFSKTAPHILKDEILQYFDAAKAEAKFKEHHFT